MSICLLFVFPKKICFIRWYFDWMCIWIWIWILVYACVLPVDKCWANVHRVYNMMNINANKSIEKVCYYQKSKSLIAIGWEIVLHFSSTFIASICDSDAVLNDGIFQMENFKRFSNWWWHAKWWSLILFIHFSI